MSCRCLHDTLLAFSIIRAAVSWADRQRRLGCKHRENLDLLSSLAFLPRASWAWVCMLKGSTEKSPGSQAQPNSLAFTLENLFPRVQRERVHQGSSSQSYLRTFYLTVLKAGSRNLGWQGCRMMSKAICNSKFTKAVSNLEFHRGYRKH